MTTCPIFSTYWAASRIDQEIDALVDEFEAQIQSPGHRLSLKSGESEWARRSDDKTYGDYRYCTYYCTLKIQRERGSARSRRLSLHFDLVRDVSDNSNEWDHARDALLVIAYAHERGETWISEELCVASSGRLDDDDENWNQARGIAENKLLLWEGNGTQSDWSEQDWLFAVPLRLLKDSDAVKQQLVVPVVSLLNGQGPEIALKDSKAIKWRLGGAGAAA